MDKEDGVCRMRHYNKQLELVATGRNVADGAASIMRGIGNVVAFATNGSYIAVCQQQRGAGNSSTSTASTAAAPTTISTAGLRSGTHQPKLQVALMERNGLRHGDFDLVLPAVPAGWDRWEECSLHWDLPTTLLAVGLRAVKEDASAGVEETGRPGLVQLYYRGNYHWYLKQQWAGLDLRFLGFDEELVNRFYLSQSLGAEGGSSGTPVWRVVDFTWDIASSSTADSSVAVVDGPKLLLTPLGINNIPPPMCKHTVALSAGAPCPVAAAAELVTPAATFTSPGIVYAGAEANCARNVAFWQPCVSPGPAIDDQDAAALASSEPKMAWGCASLGDNNSTVMVALGDATGAVLSQHQLDVQALCSSYDASLCEVFDTTVFRALAVTQQNKVVRIALLGSHVVPLSISSANGPCCDTTTQQDNQSSTECVLVLELAWDLQHQQQQDTTASAQPALRKCLLAPLPGGCATRIATVPHQPAVFAVGIIRSSAHHNGSEYEVYKMHVGSDASVGVDAGAGEEEDPIREELVASLPEQCTHLSFISGKAVITLTEGAPPATVATTAAAQDESTSLAAADSTTTSDTPSTFASAVIALSLRNRLYCGESLLASGASSFVYNESFEILMFGTLGTRPHLHFFSFPR